VRQVTDGRLVFRQSVIHHQRVSLSLRAGRCLTTTAAAGAPPLRPRVSSRVYALSVPRVPAGTPVAPDVPNARSAMSPTDRQYTHLGGRRESGFFAPEGRMRGGNSMSESRSGHAQEPREAVGLQDSLDGRRPRHGVRTRFCQPRLHGPRRPQLSGSSPVEAPAQQPQPRRAGPRALWA
jgi:hypothetical protein